MAEEKVKKDERNEKEKTSGTSEGTQANISETWAEETIADLDDFIESQGIYIRQ